ncbi:MAG: hypothetical protein JOY71_11080 [Acetobacteraceae bacterium]|nr:hypothetical protein [Acetobacteraceae bacterium]
MSDAGLGYRLQWRDFTGNVRAKEPAPQIHVQDHPTIEEARVAQRKLKKQHGPGLVSCITPVPPPEAKQISAIRM